MARTGAASSLPTRPGPAGAGSKGESLVLPGERPAATVAYEAAVVEFFVDAASTFGIPKSIAAIYGMVFASPSPVSFSEIESRLDLSKGSVSQGLRVLREVGAVREAESGDPRTTGYVPVLEMRRFVELLLEQRLQRQLAAGKGRLEALHRQLPAARAGEPDVRRERLKQLEHWHGRARALLPIMRTFLNIG
jgi:HTH-type transcriptional regulator, glycine betaine synthesis regulator